MVSWKKEASLAKLKQMRVYKFLKMSNLKKLKTKIRGNYLEMLLTDSLIRKRNYLKKKDKTKQMKLGKSGRENWLLRMRRTLLNLGVQRKIRYLCLQEHKLEYQHFNRLRKLDYNGFSRI